MTGNGGPAVDPYRPGRGSLDFAVEHYDLDVDYRVASNRLTGRAALTVTAAVDLTRLSLDLAGLTVRTVTADALRVRRFDQRRERLAVILDAPLRRGETAVLSIGYGGSPRPCDGAWGEVGWEELTDGVIVASQPDGAPTWFPCNDRPGDKATYRIAVTTESTHVAIANGRLVDRRLGPSRTTWVYDQPEPMSTYLATVQIGRYVDWRAASDVPLTTFAPARLRRVAEHDLDRQPEMMAAFVEMFGPYPFAGYTAVVTDDDLEIPVEAQGLSVFGANHVDGHRGSERLVAHELAHQWFGNSLTIERWQDIWLHEGFACYAEWLWAERAGKHTADAAARQALARLAKLPQDLLLGDPGPELMFDDRVYKRGALALHDLRLSVGDPRFFALLRAWTTAYRHGTVSTELFLAHVADHSDAEHAQRLVPWLDELRLPQLAVS